MTTRFRLTLGQMSPTAGDLTGNATLARSAWQAGRAAGAQMVALPEMFLAGMTRRALLAKPAFLRDVQRHIEDLAVACADGPALAIGAPWQAGAQVHSAYLILQDGKIAQRVLKHSFTDPTEAGLFDAAPISGPYAVARLRLGSPLGTEAAGPDVAETLEETGADILLIPDSSPYRREAMDRRLNHMVARVVETGLPLIYLNRTGGAGDDVFDGGSFALNPGGELARQLPAFDDAVAHLDLERSSAGWRLLPGDIATQPDPLEKDYRALVQGLRVHLRKAGQTTVVLALSGQAAALTAAIAADALGPAQLRCVDISGCETDLARSETLAQRLGCTVQSISLAQMQAAMTATLAPLLADHAPTPAGDTDLGDLVLQQLRTGLKAALLSSETKCDRTLGPLPPGGWSADFAPLRDLYPSDLAALCAWRNAHHRLWMNGPSGAVIPPQLAAAQSEAQTAAAPILRILLDQDGAVGDCVAAGHDRAAAHRVAAQLQQHSSRCRGASGPRLGGRAEEATHGENTPLFWQDTT